jgi:uracil-DNA glycosylase
MLEGSYCRRRASSRCESGCTRALNSQRYLVQRLEAATSVPDLNQLTRAHAQRIDTAFGNFAPSGAGDEVVARAPSDEQVFLIGEAPRSEESRTGRPFLGPARRFLNRALADEPIAAFKAAMDADFNTPGALAVRCWP